MSVYFFFIAAHQTKNYFAEPKKTIPLEIDSEKIKYWELYTKINIQLELFEEVEIGIKEILSQGKLDINTLIFLTQTLIKIPHNENLFIRLLKSIDLFPKSAENEINYLLAEAIQKNYFKLPNLSIRRRLKV